jgi:hypothetical protein
MQCYNSKMPMCQTILIMKETQRLRRYKIADNNAEYDRETLGLGTNWLGPVSMLRCR